MKLTMVQYDTLVESAAWAQVNQLSASELEHFYVETVMNRLSQLSDDELVNEITETFPELLKDL